MTHTMTPNPNAFLVKGKFELWPLDAVFDGYDQGDTWNDCACPLFDIDETMRIALCLSGMGSQVDFDGETLLVWTPHATDLMRTEAIEINGRKYWAVGAEQWCWKATHSPLAPDIETRIAQAIDNADEAFWSAVAKVFPEAVSGDISVESTARFNEASHSAVRHWVVNNLPK